MLTGNPTFDAFVRDMVALIEGTRGDEPRALAEGQRRLARLVASDAWLPARYLEAHPDHFTQYLLHRDAARGFTVLSVAWGPGQYAGPHDHKTWGLIGQLRGEELSRTFEDPLPGRPLVVKAQCLLRPGETTCLSPASGDVHDVRNVFAGDSVSIHVYGADLATLAPLRSRFDAATGAVTPFVAQYH